jgi:hypothetical protein
MNSKNYSIHQNEMQLGLLFRQSRNILHKVYCNITIKATQYQYNIHCADLHKQTVHCLLMLIFKTQQQVTFPCSIVSIFIHFSYVSAFKNNIKAQDRDEWGDFLTPDWIFGFCKRWGIYGIIKIMLTSEKGIQTVHWSFQTYLHQNGVYRR